MKELVSKISITSFFIFYLFFCGTLYLISYWSTFDFDITNYIELLDIPKSFVFPLTTGIGISTLNILIQAVLRSKDKVEKDEKINQELLPKIKELPTKLLFKRIISDYTFWTIMILLICLVFYRPRREWVFAITSLALMVYGITAFITSNRIIRAIANPVVRLFAASMIFCVPIFSFMMGKSSAIEIWNNTKYHVVTGIEFKEGQSQHMNFISDKLLGKLGSNLLLSDTVNSKIIVLNLESVKAVEYKFIQKVSK